MSIVLVLVLTGLMHALGSFSAAEQSSSGNFLPYGTPCSEQFDPATQKLEMLQCEVEGLRRRLAELIEERDGQSRKGRGRA